MPHLYASEISFLMTQPNLFNKRLIHGIGLVFFIVLSIISLIFFRERILQNDNAYYAFRILQDGNFSIEHGRYCDALTQFLPLTALQFGFPVSTAMKLYSFSFILLSYLFFLLIVVVFKDYNSGLALIASSLLVMRYVFYLPVAEFYQGCLVSLSLWSYLNTYRERVWPKGFWYFFPILCIIVTPFFHLLNFITVGFVIVLFLLTNNGSYKRPVILLILGMTIGYFNYSSLPVTGYEFAKIPWLSEINERFSIVSKTDIYKYIKNFLLHHPPLIISFALLVFCGIWKRKYILLLYSILFSFGFLIFLLLTLPASESPFTYENYLCGIGLFIGLPLFIVIKSLSWFKQSVIAFLLFIISIQIIYKAAYPITERINYIARLCKYGLTFPERRYLIDEVNYPWRIAWTAFSLPFETLMYQAVEDPANPVTYYVTSDFPKLEKFLKDSSVFLGPSWDFLMFSFTRGSLNKKYFNLPNKGYRKLSTLQDDSLFNQAVFSPENVKLEVLNKTYYSNYNSFIIVPVKITNMTGNKIPSIRTDKTSLSLSYSVSDEKGELLLRDGERTPLDVDVINEYTQGITILNPGGKGDLYCKY